jgi:hypothetical protein
MTKHPETQPTDYILILPKSEKRREMLLATKQYLTVERQKDGDIKVILRNL